MFSVTGQLIGSIRSDSSVRSTFFSSSCSRSSTVGRSVRSSRLVCYICALYVASRVRACVGYVAVVHDATECRAWSRLADDGESAATTSCCLAPFSSTPTCSSESLFPFLFVLSRAFECSFESNVREMKGSRKMAAIERDGRKGGVGKERFFWKFHARNLFFLFTLTIIIDSRCHKSLYCNIYIYICHNTTKAKFEHNFENRFNNLYCNRWNYWIIKLYMSYIQI